MHVFITASASWPCVLDWWHVILTRLVTLLWQSKEIRLGNIYSARFSLCKKGLGTSVPARVRGGQAWLPLRDSLVTLGSTLSADPGPGLRFSPLRVTTPWSNTIVCLSLGRWQPRPPSHSAIVPDDVNSSSAGRGGEPLEQQTPGQIAEERATWRRR